MNKHTFRTALRGLNSSMEQEAAGDRWVRTNTGKCVQDARLSKLIREPGLVCAWGCQQVVNGNVTCSWAVPE